MKRSVLEKGWVVEKDCFNCFYRYCRYIVLKGQLEARKASNSSSSSMSSSSSSGVISSINGSGSGKGGDARFRERTRALRLEGGHG